ncbi:TadE/TadG family type IV pilus assembly protein [Alsobacter sp. SYSU BS001988]
MALRAVSRVLRRFARNTSGGFGVVAAVAMPALASAAMLAVDLSKVYQQQSVLQSAADSAAIAGASELRVANADSRRVATVSLNYVAAKIGASLSPTQPDSSAMTTAQQPSAGGAAAPQTSTALLISRNGDLTNVTSVYDGAGATVAIKLRQDVATVMARYVAPSLTEVEATSTARMMGAAPLCMIALEEASSQALWLQAGSRVTANGCAVYSNSSSSSGLVVDATSSVTATKVCSVTTPASRVNSTPAPVACPALRPDPLGYRTALAASCPLNLPPLVIQGSASVMLPPGLYCGGITIKDDAVVTLTGTSGLPGGIYVMGGDLQVKNKAVLKMLDSNAGAAFYFTGQKSRFAFDDETQVALSAPRTGELAGFLFFEDPGRATSGDAPLNFEIKSKKVTQLLGTIYLKNGILRMDLNAKGAGAIADQSAFTVVVARKVQLKDGPNLVLNSNYAGTSVPVPQGVGPTGGIVALSK